jgi:hypothetical protein
MAHSAHKVRGSLPSVLAGRDFSNPCSRFDPLNRSSRRESALASRRIQMERTHVRCYQVHGEEEDKQRTVLIRRSAPPFVAIDKRLMEG